MKSWYAIENEDEVPSPALLVYPDRIRENLSRMITLVGDVNRLRPHVKTHKMPQVIEMKIAAGITKFKTSTIAETEMTAAAGGKDILLAYQPVGPNIDRLIKLVQRFPATNFSTIVDNQSTLSHISSAAQSNGVIVNLYLDLNVGMNRTGIIPGDDAVALYLLLADTAGIRPAGIHAYDGHIRDTDFSKLTSRAEQAFSPVWSMIKQLKQAGASVPNVIAAGTPTSRLLALHDHVEVGGGTTVLWDFGQAEVSPDLDFLNAAVLLTRVISRPTENRICLDLGHKAVASEMQPPRVQFFGLEDAIPVMHSEEHLVLEMKNTDRFPVGTVIYGVPRHICPTVALHQEVWCVQNQLACEKWAVVARARCLTI